MRGSHMPPDSGCGRPPSGKHDFWSPAPCVVTTSLLTVHAVCWKHPPAHISSLRGRRELSRPSRTFLFKKWLRPTDVQGFVWTRAAVMQDLHRPLTPCPVLLLTPRNNRTRWGQLQCLLRRSPLVGNFIYKWGIGSSPVRLGITLIDKYCHQI